jgi:hypothetical protein
MPVSGLIHGRSQQPYHFLQKCFQVSSPPVTTTGDDWSRPATLMFDTGLVLADPDGGVLWRTLNAVGDTVALLNSSNLVILRYAQTLPARQSFDHPSDTLVPGQNLAARRSSTRTAGSRCGWAGRTSRCTWSSTAGGPGPCAGSTRR